MGPREDEPPTRRAPPALWGRGAETNAIAPRERAASSIEVAAPPVTPITGIREPAPAGGGASVWPESGWQIDARFLDFCRQFREPGAEGPRRLSRLEGDWQHGRQ